MADPPEKGLGISTTASGMDKFILLIVRMLAEKAGIFDLMDAGREEGIIKEIHTLWNDLYK